MAFWRVAGTGNGLRGTQLLIPKRNLNVLPLRPKDHVWKPGFGFATKNMNLEISAATFLQELAL